METAVDLFVALVPGVGMWWVDLGLEEQRGVAGPRFFHVSAERPHDCQMDVME